MIEAERKELIRKPTAIRGGMLAWGGAHIVRLSSVSECWLPNRNAVGLRGRLCPGAMTHLVKVNAQRRLDFWTVKKTAESPTAVLLVLLVRPMLLWQIERRGASSTDRSTCVT